jgi:hypothetical protein
MNDEKSRPHKAVISCMLDVHPLLNTGECSGNIVDNETLKQYGINQTSFIISIDGFNMEECLNKLKTKLTIFKEQPNDSN